MKILRKERILFFYLIFLYKDQLYENKSQSEERKKKIVFGTLLRIENHNEMIICNIANQEAVPRWKDRADILALLRACNYNPEECIGTYVALEGDGELKYI